MTKRPNRRRVARPSPTAPVRARNPRRRSGLARPQTIAHAASPRRGRTPPPLGRTARLASEGERSELAVRPPPNAAGSLSGPEDQSAGLPLNGSSWPRPAAPVANTSPVVPSSVDSVSDAEVPEPAELAALLLAVEGDRREIRNRVATNFEEELEAVARLYWPFLLVRGQDSPGAAVFDLAGVWKQSFSYSFIPETSTLTGIFAGASPPDGFLGRVRSVIDAFAHNSKTETLSVEGFLPLAAPLQLELLAQTVPHADVVRRRSATLPTRRSVGWYRDEVSRMRQWLVRLDADLRSLQEFQATSEGAISAAQATLDQERAASDAEALERVIKARGEARSEIERIRAAHHAEALRHFEEMDGAHRAVAVGETAIATSLTLAERAANRREDPTPHQARARQARREVREARKSLATGHRALASIDERHRLAQGQALEGVAAIERATSMACATHTLLRDQLDGAASLLRQAIDGQIASRKNQKEALAGCFLPLPAPVASKVLWLPVWVATFRSPRGVRQIVLPPLKTRSRVGVTGSLKRLFGGVVLPVELRSTLFDRTFRSEVETALPKDPWLSQALEELAHGSNILRSPEMLPRLKEGLEGLRRNAWISSKQAGEFYGAFVQLVDRHRLQRAAVKPSSGPHSPPASLTLAAPEVVPLSPGPRSLEAA